MDTDQRYFHTVGLVVSFIGGGVISALINWARADRADKKERKIKFLDDQIRNLYGPLYYFITQSEKLFELSNRFHSAYDKEYVEQKWSGDDHTLRILEEETSLTLNIANKYIAGVGDNNLKIRKILDENYSFIDPDDIDVFSVFYEHHQRLVTERDEQGRIQTPFRIYQRVGDISFLRPEVIKKIKEKFFYKKQELDNLLRK